MNKFRENQTSRVSELSQNTNECVKTLNKKIRRAEKILTLAEMNRKLETEKEKVQPFYSSSVAIEDEQAEETEGEEKEGKQEEEKEVEMESKLNQVTTTHLSEEGQPIGAWSRLDKFYQRYNKVLLDKMALESEKTKLEEENQNLRLILKVTVFKGSKVQQYIDGVSVNDEVIRNPNSLFVVNGQQFPTIRLSEGADRSENRSNVVVLSRSRV